MTARPFERPSWGLLAAYGAPGFPVAILALATYAFIPTLYTQTMGLSLIAVTVVLMGTRLLDAVTDPLIGYLSDHTTGRLGRRKPYIIASVPLLVISVWILYVPGESVSIFELALWASLMTIGWTLLTLPHNSWGAELSGNYHARTYLTGARQIYGLIGTIVAGLIPFLVQQLVPDSTMKDQTFWLAVAFVVALPLMVLIVTTRVPDTENLTVERKPMREGIRIALANKPFRRLITAFFVNAASNGIPVTLFLFFITHQLGMQDRQGEFLMAYFGAGLLAIPFWVFVSRSIGKHRAWCIAMLTACAVFIWTPILVGPGDYAIYMAITVLSGFAVGADLTLPGSLQADVIDLDTLESGEQRTGIFFAAWGLASKLALAAALGLAWVPLIIVEFQPDKVSAAGQTLNSDLQVATLAWTYALGPVLLKLIPIAMMWNFPLSEEDQRKIRAEVERRHPYEDPAT